MSHQAFVSYALPDRILCHALNSRLSLLGIRLWLDFEELGRSRDTWRRTIHDALAESHTFFVLRSVHWDVSPACRYELAVAVERRLPVLALSLDRPSPAPGAPPLAPLPRDADVLTVDGGLPAAFAVVARRLAEAGKTGRATPPEPR